MTAWIILLIVIAAFAAFLLLLLWMIAPRRKKPDWSALSGYDYAHRGLHAADQSVPENSLAAFRRAVENGYGIELDVQLTADRQVVVFHDATLKRVCGIDRPLCEFTLQQLQEIPLAGTAERIPLFADVLALVKGRVPLIVEIKHYHQKLLLCQKAAALLDDYDGAFCIESFHPLIVQWFKKNRPAVIRGLLAENYNRSKSLSPIAGFLAGNLLSNFLARPDFIAYRFSHRKRVAIRVCCDWLHTQRVYWTLHSAEELQAAHHEQAIGIFEHFCPKPHLPADGGKTNGL